MAWQEARQHCQYASGGDLASIPDEDTNGFLQTLTLEKANVWVGGHRSNDNGEEWVWSDETPWHFTNCFRGSLITSVEIKLISPSILISQAIGTMTSHLMRSHFYVPGTKV